MKKEEYVLTLRKFFSYRKGIPLEKVSCEIIGQDKKGNYFYRVKYGDKVQIIDDEEINPFTNKELEGPIRDLIEKIESEDTQ